MVEHQLPKLGVAGSSPVSRSKFFMARSSSGLGHRPLKAEIAGSNPARATKFIFFKGEFDFITPSF